jgi:hypothetical protein
MAAIVGLICFMFGVGLGCAISGHVAYEEGVSDERRKWYIHAHCWNWKEEEFDGTDSDD